MVVNRIQFLDSVRRVSIFSNKTTHQISLNIAGAQIIISAEDIDYSNSAEERLNCDYQGDDIKIGFNSRFLIEMLNGINCEDIKLSMSLPNRAGLITPLDGFDKGEGNYNVGYASYVKHLIIISWWFQHCFTLFANNKLLKQYYYVADLTSSDRRL